MAVTFGFYNSLDGDREYDATQMSSLFDGIIEDGIFMSIGSSLIVTESEGMKVIVGEGRAWFNSTWTLNDSPLTLTIPQSELVLDRIDAVVLETNGNVDSRTNAIKIVKGTPSTEPVAPEMIREGYHNQYALAHIYVGKGVTSVSQANITNKVGTEDTPFITGPLETINAESLLTQWGSEWEQWNARKTVEFDIWFQTIKDVLDGDAAGNLLVMVNELDLILSTHLAKDATLSELGHVKHGILTTTLSTTWTGTEAPHSKEQTVSGILATDTPIIDIVMSGTLTTDEARQENWGHIYRAVTSANKITFYATEKPTVSLPIQIKVVR